MLDNVGHFQQHGLSHGVTVVSNGGSVSANQVGVLRGFNFPVWYKRDLIANIMALCDLVRER